MKQFKHADVTDSIIGVFYKVYNALGYGFLEKVYRNAMSIELKELGLDVKQESAIDVVYRGRLIGEYFADLVVADKVIVELKATRTVTPDHEAQLLNYLKATHFEVGLLLNFGVKPQIVRKAFDNHGKGSMHWMKQSHVNGQKS